MSGTKSDQSDGTGNGPYHTDEEIFEELASREIEPPKWVFAPNSGVVYYLIGEYDAPASELLVDPSGVLTEWIDCDPDARVFEAVRLDELEDTPGTFEQISDVRTAISNDRLFARAVPDSRVLPVVEQLAEQVEDGRIK
jgi:hypothetical protein